MLAQIVMHDMDYGRQWKHLSHFRSFLKKENNKFKYLKTKQKSCCGYNSEALLQSKPGLSLFKDFNINHNFQLQLLKF